ncbi:MAG TPA: hypothetical protein VFC39_09805 [Acidobacteriaceae bacterium]|nr:hypothetical protein [Acidobacteriaceae bacterium]
MMGYLLPSEYAAYGLTAETADAWVNAASAMMEAYCRRPSLLAAGYVERLRVARASLAVRLSYGPLVTVDSVRARFGWRDRGSWLGDEAAAIFCAPGTWTTIDVATLDVDAVLGEVRLPWNVLGVPYGEVEVTYTAGLAEATAAVKVACAQIVKNAQATPGLNVKSSRVDTLQMEYFSDALIDSQVRALLRPYLAERLG